MSDTICAQILLQKAGDTASQLNDIGAVLCRSPANVSAIGSRNEAVKTREQGAALIRRRMRRGELGSEEPGEDRL